MLYRPYMMKREHDMEAKLLIFKLIYNLTLIYGNGLWVSNRENEIQAKEMSFSTGCLGSQTQISATAPAHWPFDKAASCFCIRGVGVQACHTKGRSCRDLGETLVRLDILAGLGKPQCPSPKVGSGSQGVSAYTDIHLLLS